MAKFLYTTWQGGVIMISGWLFLLASIGWGIYTDKISYSFITALIGSIGTFGGLHFTLARANGKTTPPVHSPGASS